jgi:hypothetical protein
MMVVARSGKALLIAEDLAGAVLHPDGDVLVGPLATLVAHGQWTESAESVPGYAPADLAAQLANENRRLNPRTSKRS